MMVFQLVATVFFLIQTCVVALIAPKLTSFHHGSCLHTTKAYSSTIALLASADPNKKGFEYVTYEEHKDRMARVLAVKSFVVFQDLDEAEILELADVLEPLEVAEEEAIISAGDTRDRSMFFVKEGSLVAYDPNTKKSLKTIGKGGYCGELALFLNQPRAASVCGKVDKTLVWKLDEKYTREYTIGKKVVKYLKEQYGTKRSIQDYVDLIKLQLRPKKKKVGLHSTVSVLTTGACLLHLVSFFSPALKPIPRIIRYGSNVGPVSQMNSMVCSLLLMITMGLGNFRFPPKKNYYRELLFNSISTVMTWEFFCGISNLGGHTSLYFLDAWSWAGRAIFGACYAAFCHSCFRCFSEVICGPQEGREACPLFENPLLGFMSYCLFYYGTMEVFLYTAPAFTQSKDAFLAIYKAHNLSPTFWTNYLFGGMFYKSLGALVATFQYEKRVPLRTTQVAIVFLAWLLFNDIFLIPFPAAIGGSMTTELMKQGLSLLKRPVTWPMLAAPVAGVLHGIHEQIKNGGLKKVPA
ncbi:hypothetical protein ACHAWF_012072 [Thalassiosira exigua]